MTCSCCTNIAVPPMPAHSDPPMPGIFAVRKPYGWTSAAVVACVKRIARRHCGTAVKVGHGGTLDPLATGVLVIAVGRTATRSLAQVVQAEKEYCAVVRLGWTSTTDDAEGARRRVTSSAPSRQAVCDAVQRFVGTIQQVPPAFSAIKRGGVPAYRRARAGRPIALSPRPVHIAAITVCAYTYPDVVLHVRCGKGVYIRSIARDLGATLGTGGYLAALTRTRVGRFTLNASYDLAAIAPSARYRAILPQGQCHR